MIKVACEREDKRKRYLKEEQFEIALEDLDFVWKKEQICIAVDMYCKGECITEMAEVLRPDDATGAAIDEVAILLMHLKRTGRIKNRPTGVWGELYDKKREARKRKAAI